MKSLIFITASFSCCAWFAVEPNAMAAFFGGFFLRAGIAHMPSKDPSP